MAEDGSGTVHLVDDDPAVLHSMAALLGGIGFQTARYTNAHAVVDGAASLAPGCVIMDVRMPGMDGVEGQRRLSDLRPDLPVILITGDGDVRLAVQCIKAGATDFLEKPFEPDLLVASVQAALAKPKTKQAKVDAIACFASLTEREREVLTLIVEGRTNKEIARRLGNSHRTIEIHRAHLMNKLDVHSVAQLIRLAIAAGM